MNTKHLHDAECACLRRIEKCDCPKGEGRRILQRAKEHLKRSKVVVTEMYRVPGHLAPGNWVGWTWDSVRECYVGRWAKVPYGLGNIGRVR